MVLNLVLIGLVITLEPIPLTAFILVVASKNGVKKGAGFIVGWLLSLVVVVAATVLITGNKPPAPSTAPSIAAIVVKLVIGLGLLYIALRERRKMGQPKIPKAPPKWQTGIDKMSPWYAIGLGPLTQPWGLVAAGVAVIVEAKLSSWESYLVLVLFCLLATSSILILELLAGFSPERARAVNAATRTWIDAHTDQAVLILSLVLGLWLLLDSIYYLVTTA